MIKRSSSRTPVATVYTFAALISLAWTGCGMRTQMGTADEEDGPYTDEGGAGAGGNMASGGGKGSASKPVSSQAGAAAAGGGSKSAPASGGMSTAGSWNIAGSPVGGISAAAGSAGSRGGSAGNPMGGSSTLFSTSNAGSKATSSSKAGGGSSGGGPSSSGGKSGSSSSGRDAGTPDNRLPTDANTTVPPTINTNSGYATVPAGTVVMSGYISSYVGGSGSSISLDYTESSFCASGKVGASSTYHSWAGAGFNVNQAQSGSSGSTSSLKIVGTTISISYENKKDSRLELQLWDGSSYWCTYLPPAKGPNTYTVPLSSLNTKCWDGTGTAFTSGTAITTVQLVVPGSATSTTPFDYCFLGITIR